MADGKTFEHLTCRVAPFVEALVLLCRRLALLPEKDAGVYPSVFQRFSEPIGVMTTILSKHATLGKRCAAFVTFLQLQRGKVQDVMRFGDVGGYDDAKGSVVSWVNSDRMSVSNVGSEAPRCSRSISF